MKDHLTALIEDFVEAMLEQARLQVETNNFQSATTVLGIAKEAANLLRRQPDEIVVVNNYFGRENNGDA